MKNKLSEGNLFNLIDELLEKNTICCLNCSNCIAIDSLFVRCKENIFVKENMVELLERNMNGYDYGSKCKKYEESF